MANKNIFIVSSNKKGWWRRSSFILFPLLFFLFANLSCQKHEAVGSRPKTNSPPVITSVRVLPENPDKESELNCLVEGKDPEGDAIAYDYQWIKNAKEIFAQNRNILKNDNFGKGDLLQARVTPSDGKITGKPFLSSPVTILNSPPVIQEVWIEPKGAYVNDSLKVIAKSFDKDRDFIYYTYHWEKNGTALTGEEASILEPGRFKKGDSITVIVTPDDRETLGQPRKSDPIRILNSPPAIVSSPPTSTEGDTYLYQVKTSDQDNDPVSFSLKSGPKEMEIDKNTGSLRWKIQKEQKGTHSVEIEASDNEGAKSVQQYTLSVEFR